MGKSKTKTVGGQPSTPVSRDFTNFLQSSLGQTGDFRTALTGMLNGTGGNTPSNLQDYFRTMPTGTDSIPQISSPTGTIIGGGPSNIPSTDVDIPMIFSPQRRLNLLQGMGGAPTPNAINPTVANTSAPNVEQIAGQTLNPQDYMSNLVLPNGVANALDPNILNSILSRVGNNNLPGQVPTDKLMSGANVNLPGQVGNNINAASLFPQQSLASLTADDPEVKAITDLVNNQVNNEALALRERFTAQGGGGGRGTPGAYAEAVLRSETAPRLTTALGDLGRQRTSLALQKLGLDQNAANSILQSQLTTRAQDIGQRDTDVNAALQKGGLDLQGISSAINAMLTGRGQDIDATLNREGMDLNALNSIINANLAGRGQDISQRGQDIDALLADKNLDLNALTSIINANTANRGLDVQQRGQDIDALIQSMGLNVDQAKSLNDFMLNQRGQDISAATANRGMDIQQLGQLADYLTSNRGLDIQGQTANQNAVLQNRGLDIQEIQNFLNNQVSNRGLDIESYLGTGNQNLQSQIANIDAMLKGKQLDQNYSLQLNQLGQQFAQMQQQGAMNAINQLFNSLNQANALGTPQAQTVQKKSGFSNFVSGLTDIAKLGTTIAGAF